MIVYYPPKHKQFKRNRKRHTRLKNAVVCCTLWTVTVLISLFAVLLALSHITGGLRNAIIEFLDL